jgi:hypothetical protein
MSSLGLFAFIQTKRLDPGTLGPMKLISAIQTALVTKGTRVSMGQAFLVLTAPMPILGVRH